MTRYQITAKGHDAINAAERRRYITPVQAAAYARRPLHEIYALIDDDKASWFVDQYGNTYIDAEDVARLRRRKASA